jgi:hypothetical protein
LNGTPVEFQRKKLTEVVHKMIVQARAVAAHRATRSNPWNV